MTLRTADADPLSGDGGAASVDDDPLDPCSRFETLLAARADGTLARDDAEVLGRHLAGCAPCRAVAETLAPTADAAGDHHSLPEVDQASYELGLEVARGGMGRILAARDLRIGRPVAVKELLGRSPRLAARFEREARVTARLQHPGVVPIYEIGRWRDGTPFYTMRMVDGRTLRDAIDAAPTLAARLALLPAVIAATEAVAFAHAKRIIHRDLTPSNVLVGAYGETVVIDWGLAKDLADRSDDAPAAAAAEPDDEPSAEGLTGIGAVIGTAAYMPPEQAHAEAVDERADVYALGAILYHVLAGAPPYRASGSARLLRELKAGPPPPIEGRAPGVPRDLISIVAKAMARDPAARYPSAHELLDELKRFHTGRMVEAHAYTTFERVGRFVGRHKAPLLVVAVAALVLGAGALLSVMRVLASHAHAKHTVRTLLEERGRSEMLAGHGLKALAYLGAAHDPEAQSAALRFLLAGAVREVDDVEVTLDCGGDVRFTTISPDGAYLAAACRDVGRIWRLADHQLVHTLGPFDGAFDRLAYSADGARLAAIGGDGTARVFDTATGALRVALVHRPGTALNRSLFTPDGRRLVTTGADGMAIVWDLATGARARTIAAGRLGFFSVYGSLSPDGKTLLTVTMGGVGTGWDLDSGAELGTLDHGAQILGGDLSPDGTLAATCGQDRRAKVWDLATRSLRLSLAGHSDVAWRCVFSADNRRLLTTSNDGTAKLWDLADGTLITSVDAGDIVWWGELSPDGQMIATASLDGSAKVWDANTGALLTSHGFAGKAAHFTQDSARLVMERGDGKIQVWRRPGGRQRHKLMAPAGAMVRDVSRDGRRAVLEHAGRLEVRDTATRAAVAHEPIAAPFGLAGNGQRLAARTADGVAVIALADGATVARLPIAAADALALDHGGARLLVTAGDGPPQVWDVAAGKVVATLAGAGDAILAADGRQALAWKGGEPPVLWQLDGGRPPRALDGAGGDFAPIGFSADGTRVALHVGAADAGRRLALWATADGARVAEVAGASDAAAFDPAGTLVTAIGVDGVVKVVRARDGAVLSSFVGERWTSAQSDAGGRLVVAVDERSVTVSVLDAADGRVIAQWPVLHAPLMPTEEAFTMAPGAAWWTADGTSIVARSGDVTVWDAEMLPAGAAAAATVAAAVRRGPWRVVDGQLRWVRASLRGRVTHRGAPVAGAVVAVTFREAPRRQAAVSWRSTSAQPRERLATTAADGTYEIRDLAAGDYALTARSDRLGLAAREVRRTISDLDQTISLELEGPRVP